MEEEAMPLPVQETTLTTCPPPSTAASIANLEYPEEPLPTAASVTSGKCLEPLPMAVTESSHECPDVLKQDDSDISPEQTSVVCLWTYVHVTCILYTGGIICTVHMCIMLYAYVCMFVFTVFEDRLQHTYFSADISLLLAIGRISQGSQFCSDI